MKYAARSDEANEKFKGLYIDGHTSVKIMLRFRGTRCHASHVEVPSLILSVLFQRPRKHHSSLPSTRGRSPSPLSRWGLDFRQTPPWIHHFVSSRLVSPNLSRRVFLPDLPLLSLLLFSRQHRLHPTDSLRNLLQILDPLSRRASSRSNSHRPSWSRESLSSLALNFAKHSISSSPTPAELHLPIRSVSTALFRPTKQPSPRRSSQELPRARRRRAVREGQGRDLGEKSYHGTKYVNLSVFRISRPLSSLPLHRN